MMDTFDSQYSVEMKELIFPGYNKNKVINGNMVILLRAIKKLTSTETRILYGTYGIYRPV